jgi:hypothetical protein
MIGDHMSLNRAAFVTLIGLVLSAVNALAEEPARSTETETAPWNYTACDKEVRCEKCITPPMLGDQLQGGFNFQGGFQGGFNFQGGIQLGGGFQGGIQFGGGQFQGGIQFGGVQLGFQGGFQSGFPIVVARGAEKMSENDSPRPQDRVFGNYNYYNNVLNVIDVHRETFGFEKTFLNGDASVGLRLPFFQDVGRGFHEGDVGDLSLRLKFALINNPGAVISTGIAVTAPTGPVPTVAIFQPNGTLDEVHPWQLQPFVGYLWGRGQFYFHGFTSVMVPTESRDVTVLYNDLGVGYRIDLGSRWLRAVIPTVEAHINTPLNHRSAPPFPRFVDSVNITGGSHFLLGERFSLGVGVCVPVTGPRLFDVEALCNLNWYF